MEETLVNLISFTDFFILLAYAFLFAFILKNYIFKSLPPGQKKLLLIFFYLKVFFVAIHSLMLVYVWKLGDSVFIYSEAKNLVQLIDRDFSNIKYIFTPVSSYRSLVNLDNNLILQTGSSMENNFFLTRVSVLLYPLALGKYLLISFGYAAFSTVGVFKLYLTFLKIYPKHKKNITLSILFIPTMLFYSSPIFKETLCYAIMGFCAEHVYNLFNKKGSLADVVWLAINVVFLYIVKAYVLYAITLGIGLAYAFTFLYRLYIKSLIGKISVLMIIGLVGLCFYLASNLIDPAIASFAQDANLFQELYNDGASTSSFEIGEIPTDFTGLLLKTPIALYTTYYRPHLWEAKNVMVLFSAMESSAILVLTLVAFAKKGRYFTAILKESFISRVMLFYIIILGILIGLTTFNFGSLVRYKVPTEPFLWILMFMLWKYKPAAKALPVENQV